MTFRTQMTLLFVASLALLGSLSAAVTYVIVRDRLTQQAQHTTQVLARTAALGASEEIALDRIAGAGDTIWLVDPRGKVVAHTYRAGGKTLVGVRADVAQGVAAGMTTASAPTAGGGQAIVLRNDTQTTSTLSALGWTLTIVDLVGIALAGLAGAALAIRALRPVDRMRQEVDRIPGHELDRRLPEGRDDELGRLARAFNRLLARAEASSHEQEQFIADASHELRTPVTAIEGHARVVLRAIDRGDAGLARDSAEIVARESHRIALTIRELLELAQTGAAGPPRDRVRLDRVVEDAVSEARAIAPERVIESAVVPVTVTGDANRLRELLMVLLDNALKYSPADRPVELTMGDSVSRGPVVCIRDYGPGLTEADQSSVFARFARGSAASGVEGSGLGLPIARALAERHGATVTLAAAEGGGTLAEVQFPTSGGRASG